MDIYNQYLRPSGLPWYRAVVLVGFLFLLPPVLLLALYLYNTPTKLTVHVLLKRAEERTLTFTIRTREGGTCHQVQRACRLSAACLSWETRTLCDTKR